MTGDAVKPAEVMGARGTFALVLAELAGVPAARLGDAAMLSGLLIAAAGAVGLAPVASPLVRALPDGAVAGALLLDGGHVALRGVPALGLLLLDVLAPSTHDPAKVVDVFVRRLVPREVRSEARVRG